MSKKWIFLTCVLPLGPIGTSQAHPLDSRDIVYIDGMPCNSACQSYMDWSRQLLSASGHPPGTQLRQHPASNTPHRATAPVRQVRVPRQAVPLPPTRAAMLQPADSAGKADAPPNKPGAVARANMTEVAPEHDAVAAGHAESMLPRAVENAASAPPDNVNNPAPLHSVDAVSDFNLRTQREQLTAVTAVPAPAQEVDQSAQSDRPEPIGPLDTNKAESAPPTDVAVLELTASAAADSNSRTKRVQVIAATVIAEHVMTLRDAEKAASGSPGNSDQKAIVVMARPEINAISDLAGKDIAIDDRYSASSDKIRTAIAAAGVSEVLLREGEVKALDRLMSGEVQAAVLTVLYPETGFPEFEGFRIFRIPLVPLSSTVRL
jgi:hypothetical protein